MSWPSTANTHLRSLPSLGTTRSENMVSWHTHIMSTSSSIPVAVSKNPGEKMLCEVKPTAVVVRARGRRGRVREVCHCDDDDEKLRVLSLYAVRQHTIQVESSHTPYPPPLVPSAVLSGSLCYSEQLFGCAMHEPVSTCQGEVDTTSVQSHSDMDLGALHTRTHETQRREKLESAFISLVVLALHSTREHRTRM